MKIRKMWEKNIYLRNCLSMKRWETILLWMKKVPWLMFLGKTLLRPVSVTKTKTNQVIRQRTKGQTFYLLQLKPDLLGNFNK